MYSARTCADSRHSPRMNQRCVSSHDLYHITDLHTRLASIARTRSHLGPIGRIEEDVSQRHRRHLDIPCMTVPSLRDQIVHVMAHEQ